MRLGELLNVKSEAAYAGNMGAMEMFQFFKVATDPEKKEMTKLLKIGTLEAFKKAWELLKKVTGVSLKDPW